MNTYACSVLGKAPRGMKTPDYLTADTPEKAARQYVAKKHPKAEGFVVRIYGKKEEQLFRVNKSSMAAADVNLAPHVVELAGNPPLPTSSPFAPPRAPDPPPPPPPPHVYRRLPHEPYRGLLTFRNKSGEKYRVEVYLPGATTEEEALTLLGREQEESLRTEGWSHPWDVDRRKDKKDDKGVESRQTSMITGNPCAIPPPPETGDFWDLQQVQTIPQAHMFLVIALWWREVE
jgi:hypothetical protein